MKKRKLKKVVKWERLNIDDMTEFRHFTWIMASWTIFGFGLLAYLPDSTNVWLLGWITVIIYFMMMYLSYIPLKRTVWYEEIK